MDYQSQSHESASDCIGEVPQLRTNPRDFLLRLPVRTGRLHTFAHLGNRPVASPRLVIQFNIPRLIASLLILVGIIEASHDLLPARNPLRVGEGWHVAADVPVDVGLDCGIEPSPRYACLAMGCE